MKKLLTITLLSIHLFNLVGYPFLFRMLIVQSGRSLTNKIDHNKYSNNDLVEVKVPLNAPYINTMEDFERFDGEITINGIHHNYVKRKVSGDTLYLLCIPNKETNTLYAAKEAYSKKINDLPGSRKGDETIKKSNILNQYQEKEIQYSIISPVKINCSNLQSLTSPLLHSFIERHGKPPETNS